jgi:hypothetical protein
MTEIPMDSEGEVTMYAVSRRYTFDASKADEIDRKTRGMLLPLLREIPGFRAFYWLENDAGEGVSLSVFDAEMGIEEALRRTDRFVQESLPMLGTPEELKGRVQAYEESSC